MTLVLIYKKLEQPTWHDYKNKDTEEKVYN